MDKTIKLRDGSKRRPVRGAPAVKRLVRLYEAWGEPEKAAGRLMNERVDVAQ